MLTSEKLIKMLELYDDAVLSLNMLLFMKPSALVNLIVLLSALFFWKMQFVITNGEVEEVVVADIAESEVPKFKMKDELLIFNDDPEIT